MSTENGNQIAPCRANAMTLLLTSPTWLITTSAPVTTTIAMPQTHAARYRFIQSSHVAVARTELRVGTTCRVDAHRDSSVVGRAGRAVGEVDEQVLQRHGPELEPVLPGPGRVVGPRADERRLRGAAELLAGDHVAADDEGRRPRRPGR